MKFLETLEKTLKKEPNFTTDNGELKKWVIINKAQNYDEELIELLLSEKELKEKFFKKVKDVTVFNQTLFIQFLEQKNYLNDSYTQYKNKVGLTIDGKYMKQRNEVALVWPFKDCILEGGQSTEEQKRDEIFFNEILAQDEITQLLEPKVLTNAKRYTTDGEKPIDSFQRNDRNTITDNLLIKSNNLVSLCSLKKLYEGQIQLIYIDPPYNTGNDSFKYNDNFNHSTWLTFMKNRLLLAHALLKQEGAIYISIDQNELGSILFLLDEIFGKENRKNIITVKRSSVSGAKVINPGVVNISEHLVIYSKNTNKWKPNKTFREKDWDQRYNNFIVNINDEPSNWKYCSVLEAFAKESNVKKTELKKLYKDEYENELKNFVFQHNTQVIQFAYLDDKSISQAARDLKNKSQKDHSKTFKLLRDDKSDYFMYKGKVILFMSDRLIDMGEEQVFGELISDIWDDVLPNDIHNEGGVSLRKGKKPEKLLARIIELGSSEGDIILDFFSGSGTTGAVAHKMKRKYIICEQLEYTETLPLNRLLNTIKGEQSGISKQFNWKGGGSFVYLELKKYNETFIEQIEKAKDTNALLKIWEKMKNRSFLNYNVDIKKQDDHIEDFKKLSLKQQKDHLCELLDKNQLYVNLSSMDDKDFACTEEEKRVTKDFYGIKE